MDPFTLSLLGGSAISGISGLLGAGASRRAADAQSQSAMMSGLLQAQQADAARQQMEKYFGIAKAGYDPYAQFGTEATNRYATLMGLRPGQGSGDLMRMPTLSELQMDPGYNFRREQGQLALDRSAAARGGLQSGAALMAATQYGQDMASQEYGNAYNRFMQNRANQIGMLQGGVQTGLGAAQGLGNLAVGTGANIANALVGGGQALGQGIENAGAARASGYMGGSSALQSALGSIPQNYMAYTMMNRLMPYSGFQGAPTLP